MSAGDIDFEFTTHDPDLGGMSLDEVMSRGRNVNLIDDKTVAQAEERVMKSGVLEKLRAWRKDDASAFGIGGRPALISERAILTGMLLLAKEGSEMFLTKLRDVFMYRLSDNSRELLGLEFSMPAFVGHVGENKRWYDNTHRAFHRMVDLMDPFPQERRHSKTYAEIQRILETHDAVLAEKMKARLDEFTKLFLVMTFNEQPRDIRRASNKLDISFDQTFVGTPTTTGYSRKHLASRVAEEAKVEEMRTQSPGPVDAFAGWHVRTGTRTDFRRGEADLTAPDSKKARTDYNWGWEANIAVRVDSEAPGSKRFPALAVAATLSLPNVGVAEEAVSLMRAAKATGLQPGVGDADKQYWANSVVERLHDPAFNEGFTPSTDYRIDRLGPQGGDHGAVYIEGGAYCPGTPEPVRNATKDLMSGLLDKETYWKRIKERRAFKLHQKEKPDEKGRTVLTCPALGNSPTVTCPLRELMMKTKKVADKERPAVDAQDLPDFADKICRQHAVSFQSANIRRHKQAFDYGTREWEEFHTHARNSIESLNKQVKGGGTEDIQDASRRQVRGFGAAQVIVTMLLVNFNLRKIAAFMSDQYKEDAKRNLAGNPVEKKLRRRERDFYNAYTDTLPPGVERPEHMKKRGAATDDTGGPPTRQ